jgi:hypothetical protein
MSTGQQLTFWDVETSKSPLWKEVSDLKEKQNNLRRGLFQRYDIMKKELEFLKEELTQIKSKMLVEEVR